MATKYPKVGVSTVVLRTNAQNNNLYDVLMIRRGKEPDMGKWSLAGGHLEWGEPVRECAMRETEEEVSIPRHHLVFSEPMSMVDTMYSKQPNRIDFHFVNISCCALVREGHEHLINPVADSDAMEVAWFTVVPSQWSQESFIQEKEIIGTISKIVLRTVQLLQLDSQREDKFIIFPSDKTISKRDSATAMSIGSPDELPNTPHL
jgi:ADP-ribose pyrophosphatase YjhB (NUDIX family)